MDKKKCLLCMHLWVYVYVCSNESVHVDKTHNRHDFKQNKKAVNRIPGHLSLPEETIEGAVINYFSACDLHGCILPSPQAYVTLVIFLLIYCLPFPTCFILFQMYKFLTCVHL
ncbi:hypothetical protein AMECASPLE_023609 [Ameca splendens]|uniref:Uncharacterized protein n=1 Tax=Ameca splendens TaxID=208324 RepID=A0ABV0ZQ50_9TELE